MALPVERLTRPRKVTTLQGSSRRARPLVMVDDVEYLARSRKRTNGVHSDQRLELIQSEAFLQLINRRLL